MLRSMIYRVEELFLIHRETSLTLLHVSADDDGGSDSDLVAGMLSAIRDFARDALKAGADDSLDEFRIGDLQGWIASGRHAYLAAAIRGTPPRELRTTLEERIENVHLLKGGELARFDGDAAVFEPLRPELENCLREQYRRKHPRRRSPPDTPRAWLALAAVDGAGFVRGGARGDAPGGRWQDFLRRLNAEPGIAVTSAHRAWWWGRSPWTVCAIRSPPTRHRSRRPPGSTRTRVDYAWKSYLALDLVSIRRRFEQRFPLAPGTGTRVDIRDGGVIELTGTAPYEWIERVRRGGHRGTGRQRIADTAGLKPTYDPALARARFRRGLPACRPTSPRRSKTDGTLALGRARLPMNGSPPSARGRDPASRHQAVSEKGLEVAFAPNSCLQRFTERFGVPDTVNASVRGGVLIARRRGVARLADPRAGRHFAGARHHVPG